MEKRGKGQSTFSQTSDTGKKRFIRGVGLFLFLVGAYFIIATFFELQNIITGNVVSAEQGGNTWAVMGFVMEAAGVFFMLIASKYS